MILSGNVQYAMKACDIQGLLLYCQMSWSHFEVCLINRNFHADDEFKQVTVNIEGHTQS